MITLDGTAILTSGLSFGIRFFLRPIVPRSGWAITAMNSVAMARYWRCLSATPN